MTNNAVKLDFGQTSGFSTITMKLSLNFFLWFSVCLSSALRKPTILSSEGNEMQNKSFTAMILYQKDNVMFVTSQLFSG